jgi:poly-gamma-glutamate synthase PgsB/CapB
VTASCVFFFVVYLLAEKLSLCRRIDKIPLRIGVTGTRGKSSVTRLIAACLKESGMSVLAKTTGSKPCLILPDGTEKEIRRRGRVSILEGKMVLKAAAVVMEMMSIHPESLRTETLRMLKPHLIVVTNVRLDHLDAIGNSEEDVARCFASGIPNKSTVFVPDEEFYPVFRLETMKRGGKIILVPGNGRPESWTPPFEAPAFEFAQNIRLALSVAVYLGIDRERAYRAAIGAHPDFGSLRVWKPGGEYSFRDWYLVSAFAANDPESTKEVLDKLEGKGLFEGKRRIGLLSLRGDRGDRTVQWLHVLRQKDAFVFDRLVLIGGHARVLGRKLRGPSAEAITVLRTREPEELTARLFGLEREKAVVVGMGNMGGMGQRLVGYWERMGTRYDI